MAAKGNSGISNAKKAIPKSGSVHKVVNICHEIVGKIPGSPRPPSKYPPTLFSKLFRYELRAVSLRVYEAALAAKFGTNCSLNAAPGPPPPDNAQRAGRTGARYRTTPHRPPRVAPRGSGPPPPCGPLRFEPMVAKSVAAEVIISGAAITYDMSVHL
jgi:hypothetical protein